MRKILLALFFVCSGRAEAQDVSPEVLKQKSLEARELLSHQKLSYHYAGTGKKKKTVGRDVMLAVYSPSRDAIEIVRLEAKVPQLGNKFVFSVVTPGFSVERIRGSGPVQLAFRGVDDAGEEKILLDACHLMEPKSVPEKICYFPYTDDFLLEPFITEGRQKLFDFIRAAREELCSLRVVSRAFPDKLLCEIFPDVLFATIGSIEQIDDGQFGGACPRDNCKEYTIGKVLVHIWRNGSDAFCCNASRTQARGFMQIMNSLKVPTYKNVLKWCPDAHLIRDFVEGAADMKNSMKAAMCLLDHDMAVYFPQELKEALFFDMAFIGPYLAVDYNGGPGRMMQLYEFLGGAPIDPQHLRFPPATRKRKKFPEETKGYLKKDFAVWEYYTAHQ